MSTLTVYYDELCVLCSAEINHYRKQKGSEHILFVDITSDSFNAQAEGVDPFLVHQVMHAKNKSGLLLTKMEAFIAIWELLPQYRWLFKLSQIKWIRFLMDVGYAIFARLRPYLPKKNKADCSQSPYCEINRVKK